LVAQAAKGRREDCVRCASGEGPEEGNVATVGLHGDESMRGMGIGQEAAGGRMAVPANAKKKQAPVTLSNTPSQTASRDEMLERAPRAGEPRIHGGGRMAGPAAGMRVFTRQINRKIETARNRVASKGHVWTRWSAAESDVAAG